MNADGSAQTRLTRDSQYDVYPDWSPDGSRIASDRGLDRDCRHRRDQRRRERPNASDARRPRVFPEWSPDGTKIAYTVASTGSGEIWVMNADGSAPTNLSRDPRRGDYEPSWSPDGAKIAYATSLDRFAPEIGLAARARQPVGKQKGVIVKASCDEACALSVIGTIRFTGHSCARASARCRSRIRPVRLSRASAKLGTPGRKVLKLALSRSAARRVHA